MAYPEPIPAIRGRDSKEFLARLKDFRLTGSQRKLFRDGFAAFERSDKKNRNKE